MSARPMHQPPNPDDMRRLPPANPSCARVRAKLRDYADGDLTVVDVASVDEHLHTCRACAVELARAEHEVLRLRRAFEEIRVEQEADPRHTLRSDFAARVVEQLVMTDAVDSAVGSGAESAARPGNDRARAGNGGVGSSGNGSSGNGPLGKQRRDLSFTSPAGMLVAGLFGLFVLVIGTRLMDWSVGQPEPVGRLVIQTADDCYDINRHRLGGGDIIGEDGRLWVQRGGGARMDWNDPSEYAQPAATLEIQEGELEFRNGAPMLIGGKVLIETNRGVVVPMADGSRLSLGKGEYLIAAIPADMIDESGHEPGADLQWGATPGDVRIEIDVLSGQDAIILRSGAVGGIVAAGNSANYQGGGQIDIYSNHPIAGRFQGDLERGPAPPQSPNSLLIGHVMGPNGQPSVGAGVGLTYIADEKRYSGTQVTGTNGGFTLLAEHSVDTKFGVTFSVPNHARPDLGLVAPDAVPLVISGEQAHFERPLNIAYAAAVSGIIRDDSGAPQFGVQVTPLIIDELFGTVYTIEFRMVLSAQNGRFNIDQLPAYLPRHQRLALLLTHELLEPKVVPVPVRGSALTSFEDVTHVMPRLRTVGLHSLPLNSTVTILEEIPGLPVGTAVVRRIVQSNFAGFVGQVKVGRGRMWMLSGSATPRLKLMAEQPLGSYTLLYPGGDWIDYEKRLRPLQQLPGALGTPVTQVKLENSIRHQQIQLARIENIVQSQTMRVTDSSHKNVQRAQVFAVSQTALDGRPSTRFLGFTAENGVLSLGAVKSAEDVLVIGPSGGLGWVVRPSTTGSLAQSLVLQLQATGRVLLAENLRPEPTDPDRFVKVTFYREPSEVLNGMKPVAVRFATDGHWEMGDLAAGTYLAEVNGVQYPVVVPSSGFVTLEQQ